jgi:oxepin-CoA hydrolase/3-oxo-5,6-dehydrosuberyl-CoA semialdehyde dehydrogenase
MPEWDLFIKEIRKEMTVKAGQKCTAIRRIFAPEKVLEDAHGPFKKFGANGDRQSGMNEKVRMGALASSGQRDEVRSNVQKLLASQLVYGSLDSVDVVDADAKQRRLSFASYYCCEQPFSNEAVHEIECFGPVSTIMPYKHLDEAIAWQKREKVPCVVPSLRQMIKLQQTLWWARPRIMAVFWC